MYFNRRYRTKVVRALARALDNETSHLRRYFWLAKGCGVAGGLFFGLALFSAFRIDESAGIWLVVLGTLGGLLIGLAVYFGSSVQQWPVIREFVNVQAVREAARRDDL